MYWLEVTLWANEDGHVVVDECQICFALTRDGPAHIEAAHPETRGTS